MNLETLAKMPGVVAVASAPAGIPSPASAHGGDENWRQLLRSALLLTLHTDEADLRVSLGAHTVYIERLGADVVAVCLPTGHPFGKSIHRSLRRLAKPRN